MFKFFKKKREPENLVELLAQFRKLKENFEEISKKLEEVKEKHKWAIQKVGIVRFNPFKEMGGNQSFSIALLDDNDNGLIITSLYTKEGNRIYGKPIKQGQSEYLLSSEEKEAMEKAKSHLLKEAKEDRKNNENF
jgi:hypothetical protein